MSSNPQRSFNKPFSFQINGKVCDIGGESEADTSQCSWVNVEPTTNTTSWTHQRVLRDTNKNLRRIYEEEGLNYGKDASASELTSRLFSALKLRQASVSNVLKILNASRNVQLCFLVDVTGSMATYIDGVRDSIFKIVEKLTEKHVTFAGHSTAIAKKVSLAFVGYRDFGDANQFELLPFTESAEDFRQFCGKVVAVGGGDHPEDVFGGLKKAISDLSWSDISMCTKVIFHIADHPCHGKIYQASNCPYPDDYPNGDPYGRTAENLFDCLREKGIQYHFGKITSYTDKMIEVFSEAMGSEISVFDINAVNTLVDNIVSSVSIATSIHPAMNAKPLIFKTVKAIPDWSTLPTFTGVFLSYDMPKSIDQVVRGMPMTTKRPIKAKIQIAENPFGYGAERKAFYGRDLTSNASTDIVLKEYIEKKNDIAKRNSAIPYETASQMQTIAAYLASIFNCCLQNKAGIGHYIKFLKVQVLSIVIKPGENRYMSCERRYGTDCKYLRFSNNADYEMLESTCKVNNLNFDIVEQLMAFSHWTYQISSGYLMVVDLQGVISTDESGVKTLELTDPAIHCTDLTRFGRTNLGSEGMKTFFGRHVCNKFCQAMELKRTAL
ncbi:alpha-kinase family domain-containing protein [Ditylenchus destructor]|nr:alpha-kinase family domain-containing protein [Ditylenchus destructor]